jgi:hypothetical protein
MDIALLTEQPQLNLNCLLLVAAAAPACVCVIVCGRDEKMRKFCACVREWKNSLLSALLLYENKDIELVAAAAATAPVQNSIPSLVREKPHTLASGTAFCAKGFGMK